MKTLTFSPNDTARLLAGRYSAFMNHGKLAKKIRHLFDPTIADVSVWNAGTDEHSHLRVSLCGHFRRTTPDNSYAGVDALLPMLVVNALCRTCIDRALREELGWLYSDETRRAVALAWPDSPTLSRFQGAPLDMVRYEVRRAMERQAAE